MSLDSNQKKLISVVFSFRNEEGNLDELIERIASTILSTGNEYELIFVNDDSQDASEEILLRHAANNERIKIINMSRRFGVSPCQIAGMAYAQGDAVVLMDSDLQDSPEEVSRMIEQWEEGADVVHMQRSERLGENRAKMWITVQAYRIINFFSEIQLPVNVGDFKLYSRRAADAILELKEEDPYLRGLACWIGFKQVTLQYVRKPRYSGETQCPLFGSAPVKEFLRGLTSFSSTPLYLVFIFGIIAFLISLVMIIFVLSSKAAGYAVPGWAGPMTSIFFIGGSLHISLGIVGLYLARIYNSVKGRPFYIVDKTVNFKDK